MNSLETKALSINIKTLGHNTIINFLGQVIVALSAIVMVPLIVRGLGYSAYGLLSLALMFFGSFSLLELGLGRATTKFVAQYLTEKEYGKISSVIWTSLAIQLLIGIIVGIVLAFWSSALARHMNLQKDMISDAEKMIYLLACSVPLVLGSSSLRGALEGSQRFDLVNYVKILLNISTYLIPLIGAAYSLKVPVIVLYMLVARFLASMAYLGCCIYVLPSVRKISAFKQIRISSLFSYAGWVAVSNLIVPFLVQIDRYLIATLVTVSAVTFYAVPFEILNGLWIIPGSIAAVLFPAFSGIKSEDGNLPTLFVRPIKYILISLGPAVIVIFTFSKEILLFWQGAVFAEQSSAVLQILVVGVLLNSLSWVPSNLLMGFGRPDMIAKIHMIQTPLYFVVAYYLILKKGILGAAVAFTLRVSFESILSFLAAFYLKPHLLKPFLLRNYFSAFSLLLLFLILDVQKRMLLLAFSHNLILLLITLLLYVIFVWTLLLDDVDKRLIFARS